MTYISNPDTDSRRTVNQWQLVGGLPAFDAASDTTASCGNFAPPFAPERMLVHALLAVLRLAAPVMSKEHLLATGRAPLVEVPHLLPGIACRILEQMTADVKWQSASTGSLESEPGARCDSSRASWYARSFSEALWMRLMPLLPAVVRVDGKGLLQWDGHSLWQPVGVNPLMRFVRYEAGNKIAAHYDLPHIESSERRSLMSLVICLKEGASGGALRFLQEPAANPPKKLTSAAKLAAEPTPLAAMKAVCGKGFVFDHRLLHDADEVSAGTKLVLRTDIMFEKAYE